MEKSQTRKYTCWLDREITLLTELYPRIRVKDMAKAFPERSKATIVAKAMSLNLPSAKLWQSYENKILQKHFAESSREELLKLLPKRSWIAILAQGERLDLRRKTNKPHLKINELYFKKWSSNMAYILGFIFADGNITKITNNGYSDKLAFGLHGKDIDILKKIKRELSAKQTLSISGDYVRFSVCSQVIVDDLKKLGIPYRKSFQKGPSKIPNIPKKYVPDFIRGIVDGDGSIHFDKKNYPTLSICGRREMMIFIRDHFLSKFDIYSTITQPKKNGELSNVFYICYRCNSAKTLVHYLYENASIYLERKFKLAKKCSTINIKKKEKNYTNKEKQIIKCFYPTLPRDKMLLKLPSRPWSAIQQQANKLSIYKYEIKK